MQLQGPAQRWKQTKKLKMALPKGITNMEPWVLVSSVTESILFLISLYNLYLFIEVIVQLMAHQVTLYEVFCILLFILAFFFSFSSPALYYSSKRTLTLKMLKGVHHPPNRWTDFWSCLSANCGYFTKSKWTVTIHNSHRCEFRNTSEIPGMPDNLSFKFH